MPSRFWCQPCMFQLVELVSKHNQIQNSIYFLRREMHIFSTGWHSFHVPHKDFHSFPVSNLPSFNLREHTIHPFLLVLLTRYGDFLIPLNIFLRWKILSQIKTSGLANVSQTVGRCNKICFSKRPKPCKKTLCLKSNQ